MKPPSHSTASDSPTVISENPAEQKLNYKQRFHYAAKLRREGKYIEAIAEYERSLTTAPKEDIEIRVCLHRGAGVAYIATNHYNRAEEHLLSALELNKLDLTSRKYLCDLYIQKGQFGDAYGLLLETNKDEEIKKALDANPQDRLYINSCWAALGRGLGTDQELKGNSHDAKAYYQDAEEIASQANSYAAQNLPPGTSLPKGKYFRPDAMQLIPLETCVDTYLFTGNATEALKIIENLEATPRVESVKSVLEDVKRSTQEITAPAKSPAALQQEKIIRRKAVEKIAQLIF